MFPSKVTEVTDHQKKMQHVLQIFRGKPDPLKYPGIDLISECTEQQVLNLLYQNDDLANLWGVTVRRDVDLGADLTKNKLAAAVLALVGEKAPQPCQNCSSDTPRPCIVSPYDSIQECAACLWHGKEVCKFPVATSAAQVPAVPGAVPKIIDVKYVAIQKAHEDEAANPDIKSWNIGGKVLVRGPDEDPVGFARRLGHVRLQVAEAAGEKEKYRITLADPVLKYKAPQPDEASWTLWTLTELGWR